MKMLRHLLAIALSATAGRDLVIWLNKTINFSIADEHRAAVFILPIHK